MRTLGAVGIDGQRITAVGEPQTINAQLPDARVLDFGERTIMPGFIDAHSHAAATAIGSETTVDCVNTCSSIEEMQQVLSDNLKSGLDQGWIVARGLFLLNLRWRDGYYPTREDLDRVSTAVPIVVRTGHISMLNSKALEVVEIEKYFDVRHGSGGPVTIHTGSDGRPNGRINNLDGLLPYPEPDAETTLRAIENGVRRLFTTNGVTTICEITDSRASMDAIVDLIDAGKMGSRFNAFFRVPRTLSLEEAINWQASGVRTRPGMFDVGGIKLFADGGYSSADAAVKVPYVDDVALEPGSKGVLSFSDEEFTAILETVSAAGMQLALHTNGERCQDQICRIVADSDLGGSPPVRLEHAGNWVWDPATPDGWRRAGAIPVTNPPFLNLMAPAMPVFLGPYGARHGRCPFHTLLADGWELSAGSDATCWYNADATNPFFSMWCCMRRLGWDGKAIDPEEAVDLESALKMHTIYNAKAMGEDADKGTLEAGKFADAIVLDRNIAAGVTADNVPDVKVDYVFLGGELVHTRDGGQPYAERAVAA
jgi:predicted amidohydrolase YtcJ